MRQAHGEMQTVETLQNGYSPNGQHSNITEQDHGHRIRKSRQKYPCTCSMESAMFQCERHPQAEQRSRIQRSSRSHGRQSSRRSYRNGHTRGPGGSSRCDGPDCPDCRAELDRKSTRSSYSQHHPTPRYAGRSLESAVGRHCSSEDCVECQEKYRKHSEADYLTWANVLGEENIKPPMSKGNLSKKSDSRGIVGTIDRQESKIAPEKVISVAASVEKSVQAIQKLEYLKTSDYIGHVFTLYVLTFGPAAIAIGFSYFRNVSYMVQNNTVVAWSLVFLMYLVSFAIIFTLHSLDEVRRQYIANIIIFLFFILPQAIAAAILTQLFETILFLAFHVTATFLSLLVVIFTKTKIHLTIRVVAITCVAASVVYCIGAAAAIILLKDRDDFEAYIILGTIGSILGHIFIMGAFFEVAWVANKQLYEYDSDELYPITLYYYHILVLPIVKLFSLCCNNTRCTIFGGTTEDTAFHRSNSSRTSNPHSSGTSNPHSSRTSNTYSSRRSH